MAADIEERNRQERRAAEGRAKEIEASEASELDLDDADGGGGDLFGGDDVVAIATRKENVNLEDPRHLAEFVAELTGEFEGVVLSGGLTLYRFGIYNVLSGG